MSCPVCDAASAFCQENEANDQILLKCEHCGEIAFSSTAYIEVGSLSPLEKKLLKEYCRTRYKSGQVICHATLKGL
jgi:hypothetical protein